MNKNERHPDTQANILKPLRKAVLHGGCREPEIPAYSKILQDSHLEL